MATTTDQFLTAAEVAAEAQALGFTKIEVRSDDKWETLDAWAAHETSGHYFMRTVGGKPRIERLTGYWWPIA